MNSDFEPDDPPGPGKCLARVSDALLESEPVDAPAAAGRHDGWTPERKRIFLTALAELGSVTDAARAAGMSVRSAYNLRSRSEGRDFHVGWNAALRLASRRLGDELLSRALHGCREVEIRGGARIERHRFDNRLTLALLTRLDQHSANAGDLAADVDTAIEDFDRFVDLVADREEDALEWLARRRRIAAYREAEKAREKRLEESWPNGPLAWLLPTALEDAGADAKEP